MSVYTTGDVLISRLQGELNSVTSVMKNNIEKMIRRGEKLEALEEKTEMLVAEAAQFKARSKKLNKAMKWKNAKFYIVGGVVLVVVAAVVVMVIVL